jgi:hypothetical protein
VGVGQSLRIAAARYRALRTRRFFGSGYEKFKEIKFQNEIKRMCRSNDHGTSMTSKTPPAASRRNKVKTTTSCSQGPDGQSLLMEALGTAEVDFLDGLLEQLANVGTKGRVVDERGLNFMLSVVKGVAPKDRVEAMLAAQMAAVHNATMTFARRLNHVDNLSQQDSAERAFNKLARTFAAQVEALKRYRSAGGQTVRVEHVTVNEGGQAIVGNVSHGGRGHLKKQESTP